MEKTDNEIIAEFMGMVRTLSGHGDRIFWKYGKMNYEVYDVRQLNKYQTSWDWLMPVVEKIYDLRLGKYNSKGNLLREPIGYAIEDFSLTSQSRKDNTHKAVVEFIKWYNENKKDN